MDKITDLGLLNCIKLDEQDLELLNHIELVSFEDDDEPMQVEEDLERTQFSSLQKEKRRFLMCNLYFFAMAI
jgi:hypothetical protein